MKFRRIFQTAVLMLTALALLACAYAEEVPEQGHYFEFSTLYPSMTVKAGDSLTFDLDIDNYSGTSQDVDLTIESIPDGWTGAFSASSRPVSTVHVKNQEVSDDVDFTVDIPLDTADGEYEIALCARGQNDTADLTLKLLVSSEEIGESSFDVEYPSQEGDSGTDFTFAATLINNTLSAQSYALSANAPAGWEVSFTPSGETTKVAALDVEARSTQGIDISVTPPENVEAGEYTIPCSAIAVSDKLSIELSVTITGSYSVKLATPSGRLSFDAYANKESAVQISVTNTGNVDLTNVNLNTSAPTDWSVRFENETIELIEAGATVETTAYVTPSDEAMSGDYEVDLTAKNSEASSTAQFRVTVKTETKWGIVGIAAIVVLVLILAGVMRKFGRR